MKRLILMRHAKSDWTGAGTGDHARGLNPRGKESAKRIGRWLREHTLLPDAVLCSDATRTRETLMRLDLPNDPPTTFSRGLYLAEPDEMLDALRQATGDTILMLAHNPGCAYLADALVAQAPEHAKFALFPTCATLVVSFEINDWRDVTAGTGTIEAFTVPRDLQT
ncbi:histidine phosphatase family protein [Sulfitobacter sp. S190]|uniref:SixA phosphatase family protein n=1 Tax=Sulfitobacter sp. S190 TaxID=2867022 RepID=UPI0021A3BAD3|nr:histidine phosphatase family protein [Sulfitobacter sp. S190]UWR23003.1 histidine phosphatase family protein [Sulfitobacter sp. S190]